MAYYLPEGRIRVLMDLTCPQCRHTVSVSAPVTGGSTRCQNCGASIYLPEGHEAGSAGPPPDRRAGTAVRQPPGYGAGIASLVCGLIFFVPLVTQALAVGLGVYALIRLRGAEGRRAPAWAGLILGLSVGAGWSLLLAFSLARWAPLGGGRGYGYVSSGSVSAQEEESQARRLERIQDGLRRIGPALSAYRRDMGKWPGELDQLVPTYLTRPALDRIDPDRAPTDKRLVTFVPGLDPLNDPPERIVAYSVPVTPAWDESGQEPPEQCWVLLLNGQIKAVEADKLADVLANGYR